NVYWLVGGEGAGARMDSISAWYEGDALAPRITFERTIHFEENLYYMEFVAHADNNSNLGDPFSFGTDHYNWTPRDAWIGGIQWRPFKAVALDLPNVCKPVELCVHLQGQKKVDGSGRHRPRLWLSSTPEVEPGSVGERDTLWAFPGNPYAVFGSHDTLICVGEEELTSPNKLNTGRNYLKIYLPTEGDGIDNVNGNYIGIDWAEVTYLGYFWLDSDGRLDANIEEFSGVQELRIKTMKGTEAPEILGFDITDPLSPVLLRPEDFQFDKPGSSHWWLTLRVQYDGATFPRKLLFIERSGLDRLDQSAISRRPGEALTGFSGEDYIAIYPRRFAGNLEPLLSHRETQGHNVLWAPVEDVFDTYSGGRRHPYAIKRLLRRMWRRSTPVPEYLLLAGDASNEIAGHTLGNEGDRSDSNYVPVMTVPGPSYGSNTEVISCDHWYVNRLLDDWTQQMTGDIDMHVGRVPCGTEEEFDTYVSKVLAYERDDLTAPWRNRVILHSDGTFSGDPANYRHRYTEHNFRWITERSGNWILQDSTFSHFQVEFLFQHVVMDSVVDLCRCKKDPEDSTRCLRDDQGNVVLDSLRVIPFVPSQEYGGDEVNPMLETSLSKGALIWAFQGHSHRKQVAHERVFVLESSYSNLADVEDLSNVGKPFVFVGCGCHLTDYAHHEEHGRRGDALAEALMFCCPREPRAAIASIGSVTYEAIGHDFEDKLFEAMFHDPQQDELGRTRWRLGELVTQTKCKPLNFSAQRVTYMLLGDPALRIGIAPPAIRLSLNGAEWDCGTSEVVEYVSDREEDDSLAVVIYLSDESHVTLPQVFDHDGAVPESLLHVVEEQDPDDRRMAIEYCTQVQRRPYDIVIRAVDYDGSEREARVRIPMSIAFYELAGEEMIPLSEGSILQRDSRPAITIRTGAHLSQGDFELLVNGEPLAMEGAEVDQEEGGAFLWTLRFVDLSGQADGPVTFEVMVTQWDQSIESLATLQAEIGEVGLRFNSCQWIPSPFAESSTLVYELSRHASGVGLCIYTVSGRRIFKARDLPHAKGQRHFVWDGRDDDGDAVANGLYFYQLTARDDQGKVAHELLDKFVRTR
ncbi:MAG: hypothetical protein KAY24_04645, partial [Candidatus Eisenbacteria sp.]|nr:hypothetical protein [Candidatus Eisenbacteria bacterium]